MIDTNQNQEIEFAAFVGIDWADQKPAWALQIPGHREIERGVLDHTPEAVEAWAAELGRRFGGHPIAVALEQSRGSLLFMLTKYAHLVLFPVHPTTLSDCQRSARIRCASLSETYTTPPLNNIRAWVLRRPRSPAHRFPRRCAMSASWHPRDKWRCLRAER